MHETLQVSGNRKILQIATNYLQKYFTKISIGALCRKLNFVLIDLCASTKVPWQLTIYYDEETRNYKVNFIGNAEDPAYLTFTLASKNVKSARYNREILTKVFQEDKYTKCPVQSAKILFNTTRGKYICSKAVSGTCTWWFTCKPVLNWKTRLHSLWLKCWYSNSLKILSYRVLDLIEPLENSYPGRNGFGYSLHGC